MGDYLEKLMDAVGNYVIENQPFDIDNHDMHTVDKLHEVMTWKDSYINQFIEDWT